MFYDLALCEDKDDAFTARDRMAMAVRLGYDCVAVVHRSHATKFDPDHQPAVVNFTPEILAQGGAGTLAALRTQQGLVRVSTPARSLRQLTRLTLLTDDVNAGQLIVGPKCAARQKFDLLAVQPWSERALKQACTALDIDIISMDMAQRLPFRMKLDHLKTAVARGIHFEICYTPALRGDVSRRMLFTNAQSLTRATRGRNVIVSSEARQALELRGPYDVINLATLLGLTEGDAKLAISERCLAVLKHAELCKSYRGDILVLQQPSEQILQLPVGLSVGPGGTPVQASAQGSKKAAGTLPATEQIKMGKKRKNYKGRN